MKRVYLDLDGVMANFDAHFPAMFGVNHRDLLDDDMWGKINDHPSYFLSMPIFEGAKEFFDSIAHLDPIVLTACPRSNYPHVARQKRAWVRNHLSTEIMILPVMGGINKPLFMHAPGDILIDDWQKNITAWNDEGGSGILHRDFATTSRELHEALK
jgi:5'-nucleotidase